MKRRLVALEGMKERSNSLGKLVWSIVKHEVSGTFDDLDVGVRQQIGIAPADRLGLQILIALEYQNPRIYRS